MTMKLRGIICAVALTLPASGAFAVEKPAPKVISCTQIKTAAQLQAIRNQFLKGTYCLANDIDAGSIANFIPIGDGMNGFTGRFYGNGHVIRNLKINNATSQICRHVRVLLPTVSFRMSASSTPRYRVHSTMPWSAA